MPEPIGHRTKFAGHRIIRATPWRQGGNPRRAGGHGHSAYELIPLDELGIRAEDLLARINRLPPKSSLKYGAGGTNHLQWDLDRGFTVLIPDPGPPEVYSRQIVSDGKFKLVAADIDIDSAGRRQVQVSRIIRDTEIVRWLKTLYEDTCQLCGRAMRSDSGWTYSEGHHIRPLGSPHDGPDVGGNILILCPNHHALCDYGQIYLQIEDLHRRDGHDLASEFIEYHNSVILKARSA